MFSNCTNLLWPILWFLGAFGLGYLLRWFWNNNKLKETEAKLSAALAASGSSSASGSGAFESGIAAGTTDGDDLKLLEGVGPRVESILNTNGISTYTKLAGIGPSELRTILDKEGGRFRYLDPTSWPQQAALARDGRWEDLEELQEELIGGVYYGPSGQYKDADDLKRIEGIGPRVEGLLNNKGIHSWKQLADSNTDDLKDILKVAGGRYREMNPTSWPRQANLAANGKWEELDELQEELIGGEYITGGPVGAPAGADQDDLKAIEGIGTNVAEILNSAGISSYEDLSEKSPQELRLILDKEGERFANLDPTSWPQQAWLATSGRWKELSDLQDELIGGLYVGPSGKEKGGDDLTRLEGITPRVEGLLHSAGITSFKDLEDADSVKLRGILSAAGAPYNSLDTTSWGKQAGMAAAGKWDELEALQDELVSGAYGSGSAEGTVAAGDDLREIEGIGRSAAKALNDAGINTFEALAAKSPAELKEILATHGNKFAGLDTGSWPRQAAIAANGSWDELESLQDELTSGTYTGPSFTYKNDLKVIEGVGRRTEAALNNAGINSFEELSDKSPEELYAILEAEGEQFRMINPSSWPQQAGLAAKGEWDELDDLQNQLIAGVPIGSPVKNDLTVIEGIGRKIEGILNEDGIHTWEKLSQSTPDHLRGVLLSKGGPRYKMHNPETWPEQAALAHQGKWDELNTLQDELIGGIRQNDLKVIEGIGPRMEGILNKEGILTWQQLAETDPNRLKDILGTYGTKYAMVDPTSWPRQASLATVGSWEELESLQDDLTVGRIVSADDLKQIEGVGPKVESLLKGAGITTLDQVASSDAKDLKTILDNAGDRYRLIDPTTWPQQAQFVSSGNWGELENLQSNLNPGAYAAVAPGAGGAATGSEKDDLKRIEGIGPKIEQMLNKSGIYTWEQLANTPVDNLKGILASGGDRYKIHDPGTWPEQAALAASGDWERLDVLQDELIGGVRVSQGSGSTLSASASGGSSGGASLASGTGKPQKDDLKKVEGIGPKIEKLLNADGIMTWRQLSEAEIDRLKRILDAAGPRYRIHDPGTWPRQAGLAADGKWDELEKLQDELSGGKEKK
ncbi:MAG: helix-hairpin-helix domain-containing protein [Bacteroidota bacterium]